MGTVHNINGEATPVGGWTLRPIDETRAAVVLDGENIGIVCRVSDEPERWRPEGGEWEMFDFHSITAAANAVTEEHAGAEVDLGSVAATVRACANTLDDIRDGLDGYAAATEKLGLAADALREALRDLDPGDGEVE